MTDLRTAAQRLLDAIDRALPEAPLCSAFDVVADTADDLRDALAKPEDKSQAAFEHWVETVEATQKPEQPIIKPEIKVDNTEPGQTNPWRDAVDHELSTLHMVASDDPRESIRRLIDWHCAVQIDPLVSSAAQELIERGRREALEPEQAEPVAWGCFKSGDLQTELIGTEADVDFWCKSDEPEMQGMGKGALYTAPPRQWQTLSDEEIYPLLVSSAAQELIERGKREALEPEQAEPVAWRTFDGEGGYDYRTYDDNENYRDEWDRRNPNHKGWVEPLYTHSPRQWQTLSDEEIYGSFRKSGLEAYHQRDAVVQYDYDRRINAFARAVEEKLRAKNSTLACIPAVPPG